MKSTDNGRPPRAATSKISRRYSVGGRTTKSLLLPIDLADPLVTIPPDGGWGWVVVAASFLIMFCIDGIQYCFALFLEDISKDLKVELTEVALVASLVGGFYYLAGPITCSAVNRFGFQIITLIGGFLACIAFCIASYMRSLTPLLIILGIFGGTAFNLVYTPSLIAIGFYFERWRALAMAISCCGTSLGVACFPIIMVHGLGNLSWRSKFRYISGLFAVCGLLGLTFKPLKAIKVERVVQFGEVSEIASAIEEKEITGLAGFFQRFKNALFPTISEVSLVQEPYASNFASGTRGSRTSSYGYSIFMFRDKDGEDTMSTFFRPDDFEKSDDIKEESEISEAIAPLEEVPIKEKWHQKFRKSCKKHCCNYWTKIKLPKSPCCQSVNNNVSVTTINRPLYKDDIFYSGSLATLKYQQSRASRRASQQSFPASRGYPSLAYTLSVTRAATQRDLDQQGRCVICPEAVLRVLVTMMDFHMLKSPAFIVLLISGYLSLMATYMVFTYVPSYGKEKGLDPKFSELLLTIIGIPNCVGRAACGLMSCFPILDTNVICYVGISLSGLAVIISFFLYTPTQFSIAYAVFGIAIATFAVLRAVAFAELFGLENLTNCFGWNMIFQSMAAFSATPMGNFIFDSTGKFSYVILFTGIILFLSGLIIIPIKRLVKWEQNRRK